MRPTQTTPGWNTPGTHPAHEQLQANALQEAARDVRPSCDALVPAHSPQQARKRTAHRVHKRLQAIALPEAPRDFLPKCLAREPKCSPKQRSRLSPPIMDRASWLRTSSCSLLSSRKCRVTSGPNATPTPRLLGLRPAGACGSLHSSSHISPSSGGSLRIPRPPLTSANNIWLVRSLRVLCASNPLLKALWTHLQHLLWMLRTTRTDLLPLLYSTAQPVPNSLLTVADAAAQLKGKMHERLAGTLLEQPWTHRQRSMARISSSVTPSRENRPPCTTSTLPFRQCASGSQQNASRNRSAITALYFAFTCAQGGALR